MCLLSKQRSRVKYTTMVHTGEFLGWKLTRHRMKRCFSFWRTAPFQAFELSFMLCGGFHPRALYFVQLEVEQTNRFGLDRFAFEFKTDQGLFV